MAFCLSRSPAPPIGPPPWGPYFARVMTALLAERVAVTLFCRRDKSRLTGAVLYGRMQESLEGNEK